MDSQTASLTYREDLIFRGLLRQDGAEFPIESLTVTRWKYRHPSEMTFSFQYSQNDRVSFTRDLRSTETSEFVGTWEYTDRAQMVQRPPARLTLQITWEHAGRAVGDVEELEIGLADLPGPPTEQAVVVWLTPTSLAFSDHELTLRRRDGEMIPYRSEPVRPPFEIPMRLGVFHLALDYEREKASADGIPAEVSIPSVAMHLRLPIGEGTTRVRDLIRDIDSEVRDLEWTLSFLSRRHVRCHRIDVFSRFEEEPGWSEMSRFVPSYSTPKADRGLVDPRLMGSEAVGVVLSHYGESPYKEVMEHTISFLLAYWNSQFVENQVSTAFTAFETIVNGISEVRGESQILDEELFSELRARVRTTIKEFAEAKGLASTTRARLYEKIGELRRPAIVARTVALVEEHDLSWKDLWPAEIQGTAVTLPGVLRVAYARRSTLVHAGRVDDYTALLQDAASVHALAERLVFRLLGCDNKWLDHFAYYYARRR